MNIIEAVKSGKPFRRRSASRDERMWYKNPPRMIDNMSYTIPVDDIIADDWEIQEEKIELTAEQIRKAFRKAGYATCTPRQDVILKQLGFKE